MPEILLDAHWTDEADQQALVDLLTAAIHASGFADYEVRSDELRVSGLLAASSFAESRYDPDELRRRRGEEGDEIRLGMATIMDVVRIVLPSLAGVTTQVAVSAAIDWLRRLRLHRAEKVVQIYGPHGEPLCMVRLRAPATAPEVFQPPWPLPLEAIGTGSNRTADRHAPAQHVDAFEKYGSTARTKARAEKRRTDQLPSSRVTFGKLHGGDEAGARTSPTGASVVARGVRPSEQAAGSG
jgi:hypothetical protein